MGKREREQRKAKRAENGTKRERVGRLDEPTQGYYRRVYETLQGEFDTEESKELFLSNVFGEMAKEALLVSRNQSVSNTVELLLRHGNCSQLHTFMDAVSKNWELACTDRFSCHVIQTLILKISPYLKAKAGHESAGSDVSNTNVKGIKDLFVDLWMFFMGNLAMYMQHTYATHLLRVMLEVTTGIPVSEQVIRSRISYKHAKGSDKSFGKDLCKPSQDILELFHQMCDHITALPMLTDHVKNPLSNPVLQTLLLVLAKTDPAKCATVCEQLIDKTDMFKQPDGVDDGIAELLTHEVASHLVEQILSLVPPDLYRNILQQLSGQLIAMAMHPTANFVLQALIAHTHDEAQFRVLCKRLWPHLADVMSRNHLKVIVQLAAGALRHGTMQDKLIKALLKAFHCYKPWERQSKCIPLIASMTAYEIFYKIPDEEESDSDKECDPEASRPLLTKVNLHGSVLLQSLFKFGNPKVLVSSLLELMPAELKTIACDPSGCHIIHAFMASEQVGERSKNALAARFKSSYLELAVSKFGSRTFDSIWAKLDVKSRALIAQELAKEGNKLRGDQFGRFIWRNCAMDHFVRNENNWRDLQKGAAKKERMFAEIVGDAKQQDSGKKRKQKRKAVEEAEVADPEVSTLVLQEDSSEEDTSCIDFNKLVSAKKQKLGSSANDSDSYSASPHKQGRHGNVVVEKITRHKGVAKGQSKAAPKSLEQTPGRFRKQKQHLAKDAKKPGHQKKKLKAE